MQSKVFFPYHCINSSPGVLVGYFYVEKECYYVLSVVALKDYKTVLNKINLGLLRNEEKCEALGIWLGRGDDVKCFSAATLTGVKKQWIILNSCDGNVNLIHITPKREINTMLSQSGVLFLYNSVHILEGANLLPQFRKLLPKHASKMTNLSANGDCTYMANCDSLFNVADHDMMIYLYSKLTQFHSRTMQYYVNNSWLQNFLASCSLYWIFDNFFIIACKLLKKALAKGLPFIRERVLDKLANFSCIAAHLSLKSKLLHSLCDPKATQRHKCDIALAIVCDFVIGAIFCFWLLSSSNVWFYVSKILMPSVDVIAKNVETLIHWLMGIPIGLKLNSPLNQFLGKFFLHHVRLWVEYIRMVLLYLAPGEGESIIWPFFLTCFGLSFFIAFLSDVVSLLTFHVYCFYVYATRLYGLQIAGVMSFWRLFRGKKWNPLRHRVDTLPHSPDVANHRFFTGTLLFTILLFLLPTTALYYAIFAFLRLATLCMLKPLHWVSSCVACFPWFTLMSRRIRPNSFVTHARFNRTHEFLSASSNDSGVLLKKISLPRNFEKRLVNNLTVLILVLDVQSYLSVVCSGLKRTLGVPLLSSLNVRQFSVNLLSGKLLKWH